MRKVVVISGHVNIIHRGHIECMQLAKEFAGPDGLVYFIVNSDRQSILKKGFSFHPEEDRLAVVGAIRFVDRAFLAIDEDRTVRKTLTWLFETMPEGFKPTHFANGGDVTSASPCAEEEVCKANGIELVYGLGDKVQSSTWILEKSVKEAHKVLFP
jgi:glycerol-3-phosphate cytidylyltransferase-like family protein